MSPLLTIIILAVLLLITEPCHSLALSTPKSTSLSRRDAIQAAFSGVIFVGTTLLPTYDAHAQEEEDPRKIITVVLQSPQESLGLEISNTKIGTPSRPVVAIERITQVNKINRNLQEGMILKDYSSAKELISKLKSGPYPLQLDFINLAAGGDAFNDMQGTIVTPKDALEMAEKTSSSSATTSSNLPAKTKQEFSITTTTPPPPPQMCAIQSRRGDVLEIDYEAAWIGKDGRRVVYDSSAFRGTGLPYQLVLGNGDTIPGVDQGLYDMCPGEERLLKIPPMLGYSSSGTKLFNIPPDYLSLEWKFALVSIDTTIRKDNNNLSRQEREGRVL